MINNKRVITVFFVLSAFSLIINDLYSQEEIKNQLSLNADDLVPALFSSNTNEYNLKYRRVLSLKKNLRIGLNYFYESENQLNLGIISGIDFNLKKIYEKWKFYYGLDFDLGYTDKFQAKRKYYKIGLTPFFRLEFYLSKNFSISTEPGLFIRFINVKDYDESFINNSNQVFSSGLKELGTINVNFSF